MTIECYTLSCSKHGTHRGEEGPFCFEEDCIEEGIKETKVLSKVKCFDCSNGTSSPVRGFISCHTVKKWEYRSGVYGRVCSFFSAKPKETVNPFSRKSPSIFSMKDTK